ncbi:WhiB family transcriptional regulator [Microbacterium sp. XT11]|uniref:WhiB family transcriptional regulator n=1 Tax=Microbacterium sp. XT11 TaxID=367477 RepID=UPI000A8A3EFF|nr:WhiB family transcriptional regulator [Microbacterium sp. XT11]
MEWRVDEGGQRYRVVEESVLLAWWRDRMNASPVHFYRMRAKAIERGETPPPVPERFTKRPTAASTASQVSEGQDDSDSHSEAVTALLADLPVFHGHAEHAALVAAMETEPPGCDGLEVFTHDRFDDPEQTEMMRGICRECPLLEMCRAFAVAGRPSAGMWAGMTPAEVRRLGADTAQTLSRDACEDLAMVS